ncbi:MAG: ribosomal protein S18-alanine N-acetyltransferase [Eubacteriales bacterium]|nr:ribosomal protein S18-alanine N-acetyltransferase [Eubacteriales bacterium]
MDDLSSEIIFRRMEETDTARAAQMEAEASKEAWSQKSYLDALANENAYYLVAQQGGGVVACCGFWQSFEEADICNVVVEERFRRRGIARMMLLALMREGKARGIERFTLEVRSSNMPAIRLYEKLGFVTEGVRKGFYENPKEDALIMWKR